MRRALLLTGAGFSAPLLLLAVLLVAGLGAAPAAAQSESGGASLEGSVHGRDGQAVPNASVRIIATDTGYTRSVATRSDGRFVAPMLPVGRYSIEVSASGQGTGKRDNVLLRVGATQTVDIDLESVDVKPAAAGEQIEVSTDVGLIDQTEPAGSLTIDQGSIADLPVAGPQLRRVRAAHAGGRAGVGSLRPGHLRTALDQLERGDRRRGLQRPAAGQPARRQRDRLLLPAVGRERVPGGAVGRDREVGRTAAGFVNVVTKSGTNTRQGELFYFNRNRQLTSPDAFDRKLEQPAEPVRRIDRRARSKPDRAFFFVAAEQNVASRAVRGRSSSSRPPSVVVPAELTALEGEQHGTNNPTALFGRSDVG